MDPDFAEVQALGSASIAALKEAVIAKLQLGVLPTYVTLTVVGAGAPLRSSLKLAVAIEKELLTDGAELIAKIHPPVASGASSSVSGACFAALQSLRAANPVHPAIVSLKRACGDASSLAASIPSHPSSQVARRPSSQVGWDPSPLPRQPVVSDATAANVGRPGALSLLCASRGC